LLSEICLQYFDAVGWTAGRASGLLKSGGVLVWCLEQGADNSMTYTLSFIPDYQFQKVRVFLCFLR